MKVTFEPVAYCMRVHQDDNADLRTVTTYIANSTVTIDDSGTACIRGLVAENFSVEMWRATMEGLAGIGAKRLVFTRRNNGKFRKFNIAIRSRHEHDEE